MGEALSEFQSKFSQADEYPLSLLQSDEFQHKLQNYKTALHRVDRDKRLFHRVARKLSVWDAGTDTNAEHGSLRELNTESDVREILNPASEDPWCRYFFLRTPDSRQPLACTREQLCMILTYYQVFPSFLDAVLTFRKRDDPCMRSLFGHQICLRKAQPRVSIPSLGRSGYRIQHFTMLVGIEWSTAGDTAKWVMRPSAAYYSLDVIKNRSLWLVIKGNNLITNRIREETALILKKRPQAPQSIASSFVMSLTTHLIFFDWSAENWTQYIDIIEEQIRSAADMSKGGPVTEMTTEDAIGKAFSRQSTFRSDFSRSAKNTGLSETSENPPSSPQPSRLRRALAGILRSPALQTVSTEEGMPGETNDHESEWSEQAEMDKIYGFKQLQKLYGHGDGLQNAHTVMKQNEGVMGEFIHYLGGLMASPDFTSHVKLDSEGLLEIERQKERIEALRNDLRRVCLRIEKLQQTLDTHIDLYKEILQYKNMQLGEYFAKMGQVSATHATESAKRMEDWTIKMHEITEKTKQHGVSMHVITVWTLIFLPGTFVAVRFGLFPLLHYLWSLLTTEFRQTFFSSGVLEFEKSGSEIGTWETRWGALKLFGLICGPIMLITLTCWSVIYWWLKRRGRQMRRVVSSFREQKHLSDEKTFQGHGIV